MAKMVIYILYIQYIDLHGQDDYIYIIHTVHRLSWPRWLYLHSTVLYIDFHGHNGFIYGT